VRDGSTENRQFSRQGWHKLKGRLTGAPLFCIDFPVPRRADLMDPMLGDYVRMFDLLHEWIVMTLAAIVTVLRPISIPAMK
jgi:hypothetical protein